MRKVYLENAEIIANYVFLNPVTITISNTREVHLGEKNTITAAEVVQAVEALKAEDCVEILRITNEKDFLAN